MPVVEVEYGGRRAEDEEECDDVHRHPDPNEGTPEPVADFAKHPMQRT